MCRLLLPLIAAVAAASLSCLSAAPVRPNVVLIISDDQGFDDYGFRGHPHIRTPHLDKLASGSLRFDRGYVPVPLCRPSLASIASGLYPHQHLVTANDMAPARGEARMKNERPLIDSFNRLPSITKSLVANGYLAFQTGKWWEGSWQDAGFTGGMTHGDPARGGRHGDAGLAIGREGLKPITDFIESATAQNQPFFVWYAPFLPHTPHNPPKDILASYQGKGLAPDAAKYYAMCEWFDQTCGDLLGYLDEKKLTDNTLVLYVCDNGWAPVSQTDRPGPQKHWKEYALRSKGSAYENGIRTPILVKLPGKVTPGNSPHLASSIDLYPTIMAACGMKAPDELPGINLLDAGARKHREAIFGAAYSSHNYTFRDPASTLQHRWIITPRWKLLVRDHGRDTSKYIRLHDWDTTEVHLYDLQEDPREKTNLAHKNPDVVSRLRPQLEAWLPTPAR